MNTNTTTREDVLKALEMLAIGSSVQVQPNITPDQLVALSRRLQDLAHDFNSLARRLQEGI